MSQRSFSLLHTTSFSIHSRSAVGSCVLGSAATRRVSRAGGANASSEASSGTLAPASLSHCPPTALRLLPKPLLSPTCSSWDMTLFTSAPRSEFSISSIILLLFLKTRSTGSCCADSGADADAGAGSGATGGAFGRSPRALASNLCSSSDAFRTRGLRSVGRGAAATGAPSTFSISEAGAGAGGAVRSRSRHGFAFVVEVDDGIVFEFQFDFEFITDSESPLVLFIPLALHYLRCTSISTHVVKEIQSFAVIGRRASTAGQTETHILRMPYTTLRLLHLYLAASS